MLDNKKVRIIKKLLVGIISLVMVLMTVNIMANDVMQATTDEEGAIVKKGDTFTLGEIAGEKITWHVITSYAEGDKKTALAMPTNDSAIRAGIVGGDWPNESTSVYDTPQGIWFNGIKADFLSTLHTSIQSEDVSSKGRAIYDSNAGSIVPIILKYGEEKNWIDTFNYEFPSSFTSKSTYLLLGDLHYLRESDTAAAGYKILTYAGGTSYGLFTSSYGAAVGIAPVIKFSNNSIFKKMRLTPENNLKEGMANVEIGAKLGTIEALGGSKTGYTIVLSDTQVISGAVDQNGDAVPVDAKFLNDKVNLTITNATTGVAEISAKEPLLSGTYYVKVKGVDTGVLNGEDVFAYMKIIINAPDQLSNLQVALTPAPFEQFYIDKNVEANAQIFKVKSSKGAQPITYDLIFPKSGIDESTKFYLEKDGDGKYISDGDGYIKGLASNNLSVGVYRFRVLAYDRLDRPTPPIYATGGSVTEAGITKGIASEDIEVAVYPSSSEMSYEQLKDTDNNRYYTLSQINNTSNNFNLAKINFNANAQITSLANAGHKIKSVQMVQTGTILPINGFKVEVDSSDANTYFLKRNGTVNDGNKVFDILVTFQDMNKGGTPVTATIRLENQTYEIPSIINFVEKDKNEFLKSNEYIHEFDSVTSSNNSFQIKATDNDKATNLNVKMQYCVLNTDQSACEQANESVIKLKSENGVAKIEVVAPGTSEKSVFVQAYLLNDDSSIKGKVIAKVTIKPSKQEVSWMGTNIQNTGNNITKDTTAANPTWKLTLKFDKDVAANNVYSLEELQKNGSSSSGKIGLKTNLVTGTSPDIVYTVSGGDLADTNNVVIDNTLKTLTIKGSLKGSVNILASGKATGNYAPTTDVNDPGTPENEYSHANLIIHVSDKPRVDFTPDFSKGIKAGSEMAKGDTSLGTLKFEPTSTSGYMFEIDKVEQLDEATSTPENPVYVQIDKANFIVKNTSKLHVNSLKLPNGLSKGTYRVSVKAKNSANEEATAKEIQVLVNNASLNVTKVKWQYKNEDTSFKDAEGSIDPANDKNLNTKSITQTYQEDKVFQVKVIDHDGSKQISSSDSVEYFLKSGSTPDIIEVSKNGTITIKKAGSTNLIIEAVIKKTGVDRVIA